MKKPFYLIPIFIVAAVGLGAFGASDAGPNSYIYPKMNLNSIRIDILDTKTYMYSGEKGAKLERMIDTQTGVVCYRREFHGGYDCVKL